MRWDLVVVNPPGFRFLLRVFEGEKYLVVQIFLPRLPIDALVGGIFCRLPRTNKIQLHFISVSPGIQIFASKFRSIGRHYRVPAERQVANRAGAFSTVPPAGLGSGLPLSPDGVYVGALAWRKR